MGRTRYATQEPTVRFVASIAKHFYLSLETGEREILFVRNPCQHGNEDISVNDVRFIYHQTSKNSRIQQDYLEADHQLAHFTTSERVLRTEIVSISTVLGGEWTKNGRTVTFHTSPRR